MQTTTLQSQDSIQIITNATWQQYEKLEADGLVSYIDNEIIVVAPGLNHERIADIIRFIMIFYCDAENLPMFTFNSYRLKKEGLQGKEPDVAYAFGEDKDTPDIAAEVNFTSGSVKDLSKYVALGILEVWVWQNQEVKFFALFEDDYQQIQESKILPRIAADKVTAFSLRLEESPLFLAREFVQSLS